MRAKQTWYVFYQNCDCGSATRASTHDPRTNKYGPRCEFCRKLLGCMSWSFMCTVRASSEFEAIKLGAEAELAAMAKARAADGKDTH